MKKIELLFWLIICVATGTSTAQTAENSDSKANNPRVGVILREVSERTQVPAITGAIISNDYIQTASLGRRRIDDPAAVRRADRFHVGSVTKSITATIAAALVENRRIRWNTTVSEIFPEFAADIDPALRNVTLDQLLRHRAGLATFQDALEILETAGYTGTPKQQRLAFARDQLTAPPPFEVGSFNYSNAGYSIAGAMLERAAGTNWERLVRLAFNDVGTGAKIGWPASGDTTQPFGHFEEGSIYHIPGALFTPHDPNDPSNLYSYFPSVMSPAGNISLDISAFARYVQIHLRGLSGRSNGFLRPASIRRLHLPTDPPVIDGVELYYTAGWFETQIDGVPTSYHDGSADTFYAVMVIQPTRGRAAVAIVNAGGARGESAAYGAVEALLGIGSLRGTGQSQ